jgi:uroporphyrinogen III methyltransferase/synthase
MTAPRPPILLVGAGPGDPDLLTLRATAALAAAGTVVTDPSVADLAAAWAPGATIHPADPDPARTAARLTEARGPAVRLYRGDPWLHERFAAEAAALAARGVAYEAVPGPPAALALAAEAGIAVHHRPRSVTVTLAPLPALAEAAGTPGRTLIAEAPDPEAARRCLREAGPPVTVAGGLVVVGAAP